MIANARSSLNSPDKSCLGLKRKVVVLTLTENCNLRCVYCFEKTKSKRLMDFQVARRIVQEELTAQDDYDEVEFDLFGGEPVLRRALIVQLVEWTSAQHFKKPYKFFLETNGTLVDGKFKYWLSRNTDRVCVGLSLDGSPETHNRTRCNSYARIDLPFFIDNYPGQPVRMTVFNETVENLADDIIHMHTLGFTDVVASFAQGIDWNTAEIGRLLVKELRKLCEYYLANPDVKECSIFDMHLPHVIQKNTKHVQRCGAGNTMISYGTDGIRYPCHVFQPSTVGITSTIKLGEIDFTRTITLDAPECERCTINALCPNCYGMNYLANGDIAKKDRKLCNIVKLSALATSYLQGQRIINGEGEGNTNPRELYQTIKAIENIQSELAAMSELL